MTSLGANMLNESVYPQMKTSAKTKLTFHIAQKNIANQPHYNPETSAWPQRGHRGGTFGK